MNYFDHALLLKKNTPYRAWRVYDAIYNSSLRFYAMKIYGSRFEDALNAAYPHILENYDESKGELEHYATTVIGTINLGMYRHEISHDEVVELSADQMSADVNCGDPLDLIIESDEAVASSKMNECIAYMLPFFVQDFKFFKTRKASDRVQSYSELYRRFSDSTIKATVDYLMDNYKDACEELYELKKSLKFRNYPSDRYLKSMSTSIEYICELNGVIVYKKGVAKSSKVFYELNIQEVISDMIKCFYHGILNRDIGGVNVNCTLSGQLICDYDSLFGQLENEVVGCIISKFQSVNVVKYERNQSIVFVGSKAMPSMVKLHIKGRPFLLELKQKAAKCVS